MNQDETSEPQKQSGDACSIGGTKKSSGSTDDNGQNGTATTQNGTATSADPAEFIALRQELEETQEKLQEMTGITQHALADLQNFRRRSEEERVNYVAYANADLITELLPVLESMNRALSHEPKDAEWIKGAEQTMKQFQNTLQKKNLQPIDALNQTFDPKIHEALMAGPGPKDKVLEEYEKGYMLGDKMLKRSRVRVGNGEEQAS